MEKTTLEQARIAGYTRGRNFAAGVSVAEAAEDCKELSYLGERMQEIAFDRENKNRDLSPFEFTAARINDSDDAEALWAAFGDAIAKGIADETNARLANLDEHKFAALLVA